ncbi:MAG: hypothetical protein D4R73_09115 [Deltaproteobacteria bacterium]|nr:MAG: hypothetical protein D4R73_09115 [Deltaproteobacteria bacterium]
MNNAKQRSRFLMITQMRSGTQMLLAALQAHPEVVMEQWDGLKGEGISQLANFREMTPKEQDKRIRGTCTHQWCAPHIRENFDLEPEGFWQAIAAFFPPRTVILNRENQLHRYLSSCVAFSRLDFDVSKPHQISNPPVKFDIDDFHVALEEHRDTQAVLQKVFPEALTVTYEDLCNRWDETLIRIEDYIGAKVIYFKPTTYRQEDRPVSQIIENWTPALEREPCTSGFGGWIN